VDATDGTGRLLGWLGFGDSLDQETAAEGGMLEVMVPPTGGDVELYLRALGPGFECLEGDLTPEFVIPFDAIAGAGRVEIDLDALTYKPMG